MPRLAAAIDTIVSSGLDVERYGDIPRWQQAVATLPDLKINSVDLASDRAVSYTHLTLPTILLV